MTNNNNVNMNNSHLNNVQGATFAGTLRRHVQPLRRSSEKYSVHVRKAALLIMLSNSFCEFFAISALRVKESPTVCRLHEKKNKKHERSNIKCLFPSLPRHRSHEPSLPNPPMHYKYPLLCVLKARDQRGQAQPRETRKEKEEDLLFSETSRM